MRHEGDHPHVVPRLRMSIAIPLLPLQHRAQSRDPKIRLGSLVAPSGECMQSEGETLDLLLATHFPDPAAVEGCVVAAAPHVWTGRQLRGSLPIIGWSGRLIHLPHIKVWAWTGFSRPFCKRGKGSLFRTWSGSFVSACDWIRSSLVAPG